MFKGSFKKGDYASLNMLVDNIRKRLYVIAKVRLKEDADVCDAVQDAIMKIYSKIHTLRDETKFDAWATKILINECNKILNSRKKRILYEESMNTPSTSDQN